MREARQVDLLTTILTLALDAEAQSHFNGLRETHYPPALNRIAAHLTLFHTLPDDAATRAVLADAAERCATFSLKVSSLMSLGRGVAYRVESAALDELQRELADALAEDLSAQDRQRFRPHVVVQNKVSGDAARELKARLEADFTPWTARAEALEWWDYLGGPWKLRERFAFTAGEPGAP